METVYLDGTDLRTGTITIDDKWTMLLRQGDNPPEELRLGAVCSMTDELIYIFCVFPFRAGGQGVDGAPRPQDPTQAKRPVEQLPRSCRQLLLFSPAVPLLKTAKGFQVISRADWLDFVASNSSSWDNTVNASAQDSQSKYFEDDEWESDTSSGDSETPLVERDDDTDGGEDASDPDVEVEYSDDAVGDVAEVTELSG
jgi:hypothetical protein